MSNFLEFYKDLLKIYYIRFKSNFKFLENTFSILQAKKKRTFDKKLIIRL